ncbi:MAG: hypothetical protein ACHQIO_06340 [Nevskiales bacterium]
MKRIALSAFALLFAAAAAQAAPETQRFYGYAYDLASGKYLYTEVYREEIENGHWLSGHTSYYDAAGKRLGEKTLSFASDPYIPVYTLNLPGVGYSEGISSVGTDGVRMFKESREKGRQTGSVPKVAPMAADSGFHSFLYDHMPDLVADKTLKFQFAAAGQLDSYSFRARKIGDIEFEGKPAIQIKVDPDSLLRYVVDPLILTYDPQSRRLLEYRGISNVINPGTGKPYNARIAFYSQPPDDAPKNLPPLD